MTKSALPINQKFLTSYLKVPTYKQEMFSLLTGSVRPFDLSFLPIDGKFPSNF